MTFKYFDISEFDCQETGKNHMSEGFISKLDELREACGYTQRRKKEILYRYTLVRHCSGHPYTQRSR